VLVKPVDARLKTLIRETAAARRCEVIELEVMPDHVHLLVEVDPQYGVHRLIREIKGRSSHALRKEFPSLATRLPSLWTNSYFVSTVGGSPLAIVKQYIENQKRSER
jgi:putative transposase